MSPTHRTLRIVLGDQLSPGLSALDGLDPARDIVLMMEVAAEAEHVPHHPKKIAFLFAAMRHFADELARAGVAVDYVRLTDPANTGSFTGEVVRAVRRHGAGAVIATEPGEYRVAEAMAGWHAAAGVPVEIREDTRFLCSRRQFAAWAADRRTLRMEHFYRAMRRRHRVLLDDAGQPAGGRWNYDADNRRPLPANLPAPTPTPVVPDGITEEVLELVAERFGHHFGRLEPFGFAVTRCGAEAAFDRFVAEALPRFGDYQDAMRSSDPFLFHSVIALYLNAGLLDPLTVVRRVEQAWRAGTVPLNAAEGFIRQVLGWREYVRGIYWHFMPSYAETNALDAHNPLPDFYWTGDTELNCLAQVIGQTRDEAYAHHIQRLMVTGNFALLAGIAPAQVSEWYLAVYADAYEWVELPNTHGMALFADGGRMASKPYAASGAYIDRMSDYCRDCRYDVRQKTGPEACPFNVLYWDFLMRNEGRLSGNPRLAMPYRTLARMDGDRRSRISADARRFLDGLYGAQPCQAAAG